MRVGIVTTSYPRDVGDPAGTFVHGHARWLASAGHEVDVIAAGGAASEPAESSITVTRVGAGASLFYRGGAPEALDASPLRWLNAAAFSAALLPLIARRSRRWDCAFAHWLAPSALACALASRRVPVAAIAHSGDVHLLRRLRLLEALGRVARRRRMPISFVSAQLRELFLAGLSARTRRFVAAHSQVCAMGIDVERFRVAARRAERPTSPPTVLFLGRLVPVKGVATLLRAVALLPMSVRVCVAGAGPERDALREQARAAGVALELPGEVRGGARDALLASASVLVLPSTIVGGERSEGLPVSALEAMASGVPVIASAVGGLRELPGDAITLVPPNDVSALRAALASVLSDPTVATRTLAGGQRVAAAHDWTQVGPTLMKLFHDRENEFRLGA